MSDTLEIDGKKLMAIKDAARLTGYSRDYVARLAREKNITAAYVGRKWFVDLSSLKSYIESVTLEKEIRKKQLSEERRRERELRLAVVERNTIRLKKTRTFNTRATAATALVTILGLLVGVSIWQALPTSIALSEIDGKRQSNTEQLAQVKIPVDKIEERDVGVTGITDTEMGMVHTNQKTDSSLRSLGDVKRGVVLFPAATTTVGKVFSDPVVMVTLADGSKAVVQVDENGNRKGQPIPLVELSVETNGS